MFSTILAHFWVCLWNLPVMSVDATTHIYEITEKSPQVVECDKMQTNMTRISGSNDLLNVTQKVQPSPLPWIAVTSCHVHHTYTQVLNIVQNKWEDCFKLKNLDPRCKIHNHVHLTSKSWTCYYSWWGQGQQVWKLQIRGTEKVSPLMNPKVMKMLSPEGSSGSPCVSDTSQNQSKLLSTLGDLRTQTVESTISMRLMGPLHDKLFL